MEKVIMTADNLLLRKAEKKESEFEMVGSIKDDSPIFIVANAKDKKLIGDTVILKPGNYENIKLNGETFVYTIIDNVIAWIK